MPAKILILGHSFTTRFRKHIRDNLDTLSYSLNMDPRDIMVTYSGRPGGTVQVVGDAQLEEAHIREFSPDVVILQIGSNDLCRANKSPVSVCEEIRRLSVLLLTEFQVKKVVILQILHRLPNRTPNPRHLVDIPWFNGRVDRLNFLLSHNLNKDNVLFWPHKGLRSAEKLAVSLLPDGVHLNHNGYNKYFQTVRAAVVTAVKQIRHLD